MRIPSSVQKRAMKWVAGIGLVSATYFMSSEFDSPDQRGSGELIHPVLVGKLDSIREDVGFPLIINSGVRTETHNEQVGGVTQSAHTYPCYCAVDVRYKTKAQQRAIIGSAKKHGITRIGIGRTFIHMDIDTTKPQNVVWYY